MYVLNTLAILFSMAYGTTAYLSKRESLLKAQSGNEESSLSDKDVRRLLLLAAFWYQWFVVGFPFGQLASYVKISWVESLFDAVGISSLVFMLGGAIAILCNEHLRKARLSLKLANPKLEIISWVLGLAMCAFLITSKCV